MTPTTVAADAAQALQGVTDLIARLVDDGPLPSLNAIRKERTEAAAALTALSEQNASLAAQVAELTRERTEMRLRAEESNGDIEHALHQRKQAIDRAEAAEAKVARLEGALRDMPKKVRHTTVCQGPNWPDDRPGVWIAALTACEAQVQQVVDAALAAIHAKDKT